MTEPVVSTNPATGERRTLSVFETTADDVDHTLQDARPAHLELAAATPAARAALLRCCSRSLESSRADIVEAADAETALGRDRLNGELDRCRSQFEFFADVVEDGAWIEATIDESSGPQPDVRRLVIPIGIVAVFGASNFPLAFSVPGGDTASALAAGCAVVAKAHPAHPETCILTTDALRRAGDEAGFGANVVSSVYGHEAGRALVQHRSIAAVGFTGSRQGADALCSIITQRPEPVPFFGEMGGINPVVVTPRAADERLVSIAQGYVDSWTLGLGQLCTKPGLILIPHHHRASFVEAVRAAMAASAAGTLLTNEIASAFRDRRDRLGAVPNVESISGGPSDASATSVSPEALVVAVDNLVADPGLLVEECFGPLSVIATYRSISEVIDALGLVTASLTATLHTSTEGTPDDATDELIPVLTAIGGRVVINGFPTGVRVGWAMHHGGGYPTATSPHFTSVGASAMRRWLIPRAFQGFPDRALPAPLQRSNPWRIPRRVNGVVESPSP